MHHTNVLWDGCLPEDGLDLLEVALRLFELSALLGQFPKRMEGLARTVRKFGDMECGDTALVGIFSLAATLRSFPYPRTPCCALVTHLWRAAAVARSACDTRAVHCSLRTSSSLSVWKVSQTAYHRP